MCLKKGKKGIKKKTKKNNNNNNTCDIKSEKHTSSSSYISNKEKFM